MRASTFAFLALTAGACVVGEAAPDDGEFDPDDGDDDEAQPAGPEGDPADDDDPNIGSVGYAPGQVLWTSAAWSNGQSRTLTKAHAFDPYDARTELAAGEGRKWTTSGNGSSRLEGNRSRLYIHANHRSVSFVFEANATDSRLENISTKVRSRHNEGGSVSNRFGGYGVAFNLKKQTADFKIEGYHNSHESGRSHRLPTKLLYDHWYRYKVTIQAKDNDTKAVVKAYIDYELDGAWTWVGTETYDRTGYRKNDRNAKYVWIRANSGDAIQKGLLLRNGQLTEIAAL